MRVLAARRTWISRLPAAAAGVLAALAPAVAAAQEAGRKLEAPADTQTAVILVLLGIAAVMLASAITFLYRRQRQIRWDYQLPEGWLSEGHGVDPDAAHNGDAH